MGVEIKKSSEPTYVITLTDLTQANLQAIREVIGLRMDSEVSQAMGTRELWQHLIKLTVDPEKNEKFKGLLKIK